MKNSLLLVFIFYCFTTIAQVNSFGYFSVNAGVNAYGFKGDLNQNLSRSIILSGIKKGWHAGIEKRFSKYIGASVEYHHGKLEQFEITRTGQKNFQTPFSAVFLRTVLYSDNGKIFEPKNPFSLFLSSGIGYIFFTPYTDAKDSNGIPYNYWSDGTIRSEAETIKNANAPVVKRDYIYETKIADTASYKIQNQAIVIPVSIGLKYQLTPNIQTRIATDYYMPFTDDLDGIRKNNDFDKFLALSVAINCTIGKIERKNKLYKDIKFSEIFHEDSDKDGIEDAKDQCQQTPIDVKIDENGCPVDTDKDGVPDYMDDEPHTKPGQPVNAHGVTITDEMFEMMALLRDSAITTRTVTFYEEPSMDILRKIDLQIREHRKQMAKIKAQSILPEQYKFADTNNDGIIQSNEVINVIEGFLDGTFDISLDKVYEIIDYFFEQ